jgi:prevent-host-death family protein
MTKVNMHEAKTRLSQLVELAKKGEEVIIAKNGKDEVRLVPIAAENEWFGMYDGQGWISPDFNEMTPDLEAAFAGDDEKVPA